MKKYYYLYKITNQLNGKIYIGVHQTSNLDDGYMGSGIALKRAKEKYGIENFTKEILQHFENREEMYIEETILVDKEFILREDTYNLTEGGHGGSFLASSKGGIKGGITQGKKNYELGTGMFSEEGKENLRMYNISEKNLKILLENSRKIAESEEIRTKIKATMKKNKHGQGSNNSQFGTMWITNGLENIKIKKNEDLPRGFRKGRKIKT